MRNTTKPRALVIACVILTLSLGLGACSKDPAQLFESAKQREIKGDRAGAIIDLKAAIQQQPNDPAMRFALGRLHNEVFEGESAEKELRKALDLGALEGGRVIVELARALRVQGKFKEIISDVKPATAYEPELLASIYALRGRAAHALLDVREAEGNLGKARAASPENLDAYLLDAQIRAGRRDFKSALQVVGTVLEKDQKHFDALTYKAELLRATGDDAGALEAYAKVLALNPVHFGVLLSRSSMLLGQGKLDEAQRDVDALRQRYKGHPLVIVQQGIIQLARGQAREALESSQIVLKSAPDLPAAHLLAGLSHSALGSALQAEQTLSKVVAENPRAIIARKALADSLLRLNQPRRALDIIEPVIRADAADAQIYALAGDAYMRLGDNAVAIAWFEKAASVKPGDVEVKIKRSMAQMGAGQLDSGLDGLEGAVGLLKHASRADEMLILVYLSKQMLDRAWEGVQALEKRAGSDPVISNLRGLVLVAKGDLDAARSAFSSSLKLNAGFLPGAKNLAQLDLHAGKVEDALKRYESVLASDARNTDAMLGLAALEYRIGRIPEAIKTLERAVSIGPAAIEPRLQLIHLYLITKDTRKALTLAEEGLASANGDNPNLIVSAAQAMMASGNENSAVQTMNKLVRLHPTSDFAHFQMARFQLSLKRLKEAESSLNKTLEISPRHPDALLALALLFVDSKRFDDAIALARKVQKTQPKAPVGFVLEGEIHEKRNRLAEAALSYRRALELQPSGGVAVKLFSARGQAGELSVALAELRDWVDRNPDQAFARSKLADALMIRGDYKLAAAHYERVLATEAMTVETINNLGWAYHKIGDPRAVKVAERAYTLAPNNPSIVDTYGWVLVQSGEVAKGLPLLKKASELAPEHPSIHYHLAFALAKSGDSSAARTVLAKVLAVDKPFPEAADARGLLKSLN